MAEFCQFEKKIELFMPYQHELPNIYVKESMVYSLIYFLWRLDAPVSLLQGGMCQSLIDNDRSMIDMKNMSVVAIYLSLVYIYLKTRNISRHLMWHFGNWLI